MQQQQKQVSLGGGVSVCRPSGSRWTPTAEQLRILKELYYGCGVRSPTAEQIQRITAMLRQHGKIEGKNVFYWFQNHKARERQKKRLTNLDVNNVVPAADVSHLGILSLSPSSGVIDAGATSPSSTLGMYTGNGGASAMQLDTTADWDNTAMATEGCFLQDYMGVRGAGGVHGVAASPWAWFSSPEQRTTMTTRAPETLPLFPTGDDDNRPRPRQGGPPPGGDGSYYLPDLSFWGAAPTAATSSITTVTIQQHHQLVQMQMQQQQQYSFYSSSNQMPNHETQDTAGASLELSLSSSASWCSPYHAGRTM
ncbi:hypothetical protein PR202_ga18696 [Eleusine coracana subsp. coracana]|uniref:Homeobox domain-containing protein n=1 Tax=Eleusine coracana subsp. coracana TaxID=191504 RepID=A0AAV5CTC7_ELECO|nr:hypothetical protein QOZ80_4AG0300560 [Eleusine coracana subsp. coracana]GJN01430.1 hypothetical protein PR202_ga18696 [Eleusine coracana subsp. coracana]